MLLSGCVYAIDSYNPTPSADSSICKLEKMYPDYKFKYIDREHGTETTGNGPITTIKGSWDRYYFITDPSIGHPMYVYCNTSDGTFNSNLDSLMDIYPVYTKIFALFSEDTIVYLDNFYTYSDKLMLALTVCTSYEYSHAEIISIVDTIKSITQQELGIDCGPTIDLYFACSQDFLSSLHDYCVDYGAYYTFKKPFSILSHLAYDGDIRSQFTNSSFVHYSVSNYTLRDVWLLYNGSTYNIIFEEDYINKHAIASDVGTVCIADEWWYTLSSDRIGLTMSYYYNLK